MEGRGRVRNSDEGKKGQESRNQSHYLTMFY